MKRIWLGAALAVLAACGDQQSDTADADMPGASESAAADLETLENYTLTMDNVERSVQAGRNLQALQVEHPELQQELENRWGEEDAQSLDDLVKRMDSEPEIREAIEDAGLSTREYALTTFALMQAAFANFGLQQDSTMELPEGVNPENVAFFQEHEAELRAMMGEQGGE